MFSIYYSLWLFLTEEKHVFFLWRYSCKLRCLHCSYSGFLGWDICHKSPRTTLSTEETRQVILIFLKICYITERTRFLKTLHWCRRASASPGILSFCIFSNFLASLLYLLYFCRCCLEVAPWYLPT